MTLELIWDVHSFPLNQAVLAPQLVLRHAMSALQGYAPKLLVSVISQAFSRTPELICLTVSNATTFFARQAPARISQDSAVSTVYQVL